MILKWNNIIFLTSPLCDQSAFGLHQNNLLPFCREHYVCHIPFQPSVLDMVNDNDSQGEINGARFDNSNVQNRYHKTMKSYQNSVQLELDASKSWYHMHQNILMLGD